MQGDLLEQRHPIPEVFGAAGWHLISNAEAGGVTGLHMFPSIATARRLEVQGADDAKALAFFVHRGPFADWLVVLVRP